MRVVFAHPRREYASYVDYRRLAELGGFEVCRVDQIDLARDDTIFIVSPPNRTLYERLSRFGPRSARAKVVVWNLERPDVRTVNIRHLRGNEVHASTESLARLPGVAAIWVSDRHLATLDKRYTFVPLGSDARLAEGEPMAPTWDLCHISHINGRRSVIDQIGRSLRVAPAATGAERIRILRTSRAILNVHQTPCPVGEPLRFALAAAYGLPLISETIRDPRPLGAGTTFVEIDFDRLLYEVPAWLTDPDRHARLVQSGRNLQRLLTVDTTFESAVREAAAQLGRRLVSSTVSAKLSAEVKAHPFARRPRAAPKPFVTFKRLGQFGRLGNQLFQVAAVIGAARKNDCDFMLPRWEAARDLCGALAFHDRIPHARTLVERTFHYSEIRIAGPVDLCGFFQSERYFQHCADEIRRAFAPAAPIEQAIARRLAPLFERGPVCSVHVRRTDYVGHPVFFDLAADGYYERAFDRLPGHQFLVFSDDIPWCRERFVGPNFHFSVGASAIEDLFLMSRCHAHIIANSSLSWWGAWLDPNPNKTVIGPARWFAGPRPEKRKKHGLRLPIPGVRETRDLLPEAWIKL